MANPNRRDTLNTAPFDEALERLAVGKTAWVATTTAGRIALLQAVRARLADHAEEWVTLAGEAKGLPASSPLLGEEWASGPWALLVGIDLLIRTLGKVDGRRHLDGISVRSTRSGQTAARVFPLSWVDRLLLSGVEAEVWMEPGVLPQTLRTETASAYASPRGPGRVALVLGAGNITAIAPLDAIHKLFAEHSVALIKLNPVLERLKPVFDAIFEPLIAAGYLAIVNGGADAGAYLTNHRLVETMHITGSIASHDAIVFGTGREGAERKAAAQPLNPRPITSELGAVGPAIIVPGNWTKADLRFQAEHIATQKLHNSGFNCIAAQVVVMSRDWPLADAFLAELRRAIADAPARPAYYPGAPDRMDAFQAAHPTAERIGGHRTRRLVATIDADAVDQLFETEIFGPALGIVLLPHSEPAAFLEHAIAFANKRLHGTLGANILIDPRTEKALGDRFEDLVADLHYGTIAINAWSGLGFLLSHVPWGAFPGHPIEDAQSGRGVVHNGFLFDRPERSIVRAPFRPAPRGLLHGSFAVLPRPPWFVTNRTAATTLRRMFAYQLRPSLLRLLGVLTSAVRG